MPFSIWLSRRFGDGRAGERKVRGSCTGWGGLGIALSFLRQWARSFDFSKGGDAVEFQAEAVLGRKWSVYFRLKHNFGDTDRRGFCAGIGYVGRQEKCAAALKLSLQVVAAYIAMDFGVRLSGISVPGGEYYGFPLLVSQFVTVLWLTGFMNTINLVDGLDGLAAGICAIASGVFLVVAILQGQSQVVLFSKQMKLAGILSAALCGACVGFLWYNFFPAKVFMGDGGALFLGYMLAAITVIGTLKTTALFSLVIPIVVVALPVMDVALSIVRRFRNGKEIFEDKEHLHHQLLKQGWNQREVVLLVYVITLVLSIFSILLTVFKGRV